MPAPGSVFIVPSGDPAQPGVWQQDQPFRRTLRAAAPQGVTFFTDPVDTGRVSHADQAPHYLALLQKQYGGQPVDLVVGIGERVVDFIRDHGSTLWPGAQVPIDSVAAATVEGSRLPQGAQLMFWKVAIDGTLDLAETLQPRARRPAVRGLVLQCHMRPRSPAEDRRDRPMRRAAAALRAMFAGGWHAVALGTALATRVWAADATPAPNLQPATLVRGLSHPWGLAFLPDFDGTAGRMLVTERPGRLRLASAGGAVGPPIAGVPEVDARGQGGLLDVALDPKFADNGLVYLSYAEAGEGGNATAVGRARLEAEGLQGRLVDWKVIYRQRPKVQSTLHFGSRLVFSRDGSRLFVTLGDRYLRREEAQDPRSDLGKVMRLAPDGATAAELWSIGHRNVQGAALHPATGALWAHEHGPQGGDEVNIVEAGRNYGWPVATYGVEYVTGRKIGEGPSKPGMESPLWHWVPSIAPSGMAFLTSARYGAAWKGSLFVGALKGRMLVRLQLDGNRVIGEQRLLQGQVGRIRDVRQGPDGWLYLLTDEDDGRIVRVELAPVR